MLEDHLKPKIALWLHIAVGVFIGITAAVFLFWRIASWQAEAAAAGLAEKLRQSAEQSQQAQAAAKYAAAQAEVKRRQQTDEGRRYEEAAQARRAAEAERRELAWTRFYRKPAACDEAKGGSWSVDCANDYMRARKKFADEFDAGKL
ncbi:hypothetical protein [Roseateles sp.]|uniref:hypothetical protein n=1 Tax=Roseateles sp. TaxID=1971397 RepID=UPI0025F7C611|nr:hypothetical protein [Roseateles sp.]MBV8035925.1 hypothetical protein [Roseateles sp.]